jgi:hypothetical protein
VLKSAVKVTKCDDWTQREAKEYAHIYIYISREREKRESEREEPG